MATEQHETYDGEGNLIDVQDVEIPVEQANDQALRDKARQARDRCREIANTDTQTTAQQNAVIKELARICANLIPLLLSDPTDSGD